MVNMLLLKFIFTFHIEPFIWYFDSIFKNWKSVNNRYCRPQKYEIRQHLNTYYNRYLKKKLVLLAWLDFTVFVCQILWSAVVVHNYSDIWFVKTIRKLKYNKVLYIFKNVRLYSLNKTVSICIANFRSFIQSLSALINEIFLKRRQIFMLFKFLTFAAGDHHLFIYMATPRRACCPW